MTMLGTPGKYLLGLVHGHYGVKEISDLADDDFADQEIRRSLNMGIAIVVPVDDILSTLLHDPKLRSRREALRSLARGQAQSQRTPN